MHKTDMDLNSALEQTAKMLVDVVQAAGNLDMMTANMPSDLILEYLKKAFEKIDPSDTTQKAHLYATYLTIEAIKDFQAAMNVAVDRAKEFSETQHPHWIPKKTDEELMDELKDVKSKNPKNSPWLH